VSQRNGNGVPSPNGTEIAIYYEHPEWFRPMFAEFDRRGIRYERQLAHQHAFDPALRRSPYALVFNRMSPSAFSRGHAQAIPYTLEYMAYLRQIGANVVNGYEAYVNEFSKARQVSLLEKLGIRYPRAQIINHPSQAVTAADSLEFPIIIKPNLGGSGAGIQPFHTRDELRHAIEAGAVELGLTSIALVQEKLPVRDNSIIRVEILNGEYLYAIRVHLTSGDSFNLCPADYCDLPENQVAGEEGAKPLIEAFTPPAEAIETVKRITRAAGIEVGGVEYLVNDRDGERYYYDINALSNFVADAPNVVGFDPFVRLVDFLELRAGRATG